MQEEHVDQAEGTEQRAGEAADTDMVDAVDQQAAASDGSASEAEPEVPDDASDTIKAAQAYIGNLDMDQQRTAAKKAI